MIRRAANMAMSIGGEGSGSSSARPRPSAISLSWPQVNRTSLISVRHDGQLAGEHLPGNPPLVRSQVHLAQAALEHADHRLGDLLANPRIEPDKPVIDVKLDAHRGERGGPIHRPLEED